jgi:hypothetical protein
VSLHVQGRGTLFDAQTKCKAGAAACIASDSGAYRGRITIDIQSRMGRRQTFIAAPMSRDRQNLHA